MQKRRYSTLKHLALFGLVGPPIGGFAILFWSHFAGDPPLPFELRGWLFTAFPIAYVYAGVPALITGYSAALVRAKAPGSGWPARAIRFAVPLLVGSVASVLFSLVTIASEPDAALALVGALAAFLCTALAEWLHWLRPNNSFKPKPLRGSA
jgi:hypothetical protein